MNQVLIPHGTKIVEHSDDSIYTLTGLGTFISKNEDLEEMFTNEFLDTGKETTLGLMFTAIKTRILDKYWEFFRRDMIDEAIQEMTKWLNNFVPPYCFIETISNGNGTYEVRVTVNIEELNADTDQDHLEINPTRTTKYLVYNQKTQTAILINSSGEVIWEENLSPGLTPPLPM